VENRDAGCISLRLCKSPQGGPAAQDNYALDRAFTFIEGHRAVVKVYKNHGGCSSAEPLSADKTLPTYDDVISDSGSACPYR